VERIVEWRDADQVTDEASFLSFIRALARDRADEVRKEAISPSHPFSAGVNGWQNGSIETFLDAAHEWGESSVDGLQHYRHPRNPWTRAAHIIAAGKYYE